MKQELTLSLKQKQIISLQQQESLLILAMNAQQLINFMDAEAEENPLIEFRLFEPIRTISYNRDDDDDDDVLHNIPSPDSTTPEEILMSQIPPALCDTEENEQIFRMIARSVDSNGFLLATPGEIASDIGKSVPDVERCLRVMKTLEPAGICASSLEECLLIQLARNGSTDKILTEIISKYLRPLMEGKFACITKELGISGADLNRCLTAIKTLNPKPLNGMLGGAVQYIIPDIVLSYVDCGWKAELNDNWLENYSLNDYYVKMYRTTNDSELKEYFRSKMARIKFVRDAVKKRRDTLIAIAERLAVYQSGFLLKKGPLVPLTMSDLSKEIGVHASTVSRAIREKYIQYPHGVSEIRALFTSGLPASSPSGSGEISRGEIKSRLQLLINAEDKAKPYSDQWLSQMLRAEGIGISRRTVAKYREELGINGAYDRKYA